MTIGTKTVIYGPTGIGKSELFELVNINTTTINLKSKMINFKDPSLIVLNEFKKTLAEAVRSEHEVIVINSLDAIESLIFKDLVKSNECESIEHVDGGYSKGYVRAKEKWESIFGWINDKVLPTGKHLVFLASQDVYEFKNPFGLQYSKFGLRVNKHSAGLIESEMDNILFMTHAGLFNPEREGIVFHTRASIAFTAKNNCGLPNEISGVEFEKHFKGGVLGHEQQEGKVAL